MAGLSDRGVLDLYGELLDLHDRAMRGRSEYSMAPVRRQAGDAHRAVARFTDGSTDARQLLRR